MLFLEAKNIKKYYSDRLIFEFDELKIFEGDKIGVVGLNGSGKTTLLNILAKAIEPDEGIVKSYKVINYIRQFSDEVNEADPKLSKEFGINTLKSAYSGGEKTRVKIANGLTKSGTLLLADEPTANLDYKGVEVLKEKLISQGTFLLISHDRTLLDELCNKILEVKDGRIKLYNGNYTFYKEESQRGLERQVFEYEQYISQKGRLEEAIEDRKNRVRTMKKTPSRMGNSEARLHKRETTEIQQKINRAVDSMKTRLEKLEVKERPKEEPTIKLDFSLTNPPENKIIISSNSLSFRYGERIIFDNAKFNIFKGKKAALWGENGTGKTTLLNLIANGVEDSIYTVPKAKIGYFYQGFENLDYDKTVLENVMSDSVQSQTVVRTVLARLLIMGDAVNKKVGVLSGGERIKVGFAKLFVSNANVLLLDEPTNFLDMQSIEALEEVLASYEGTVVFVSHDRTFVNKIADKLLVIKGGKIIEFDGNLKKYEQSTEPRHTKINNEMNKTIIQMKITEIISKISFSKEVEKEELEKEYQNLLRQLKE